MHEEIEKVSVFPTEAHVYKHMGDLDFIPIRRVLVHTDIFIDCPTDRVYLDIKFKCNDVTTIASLGTSFIDKISEALKPDLLHLHEGRNCGMVRDERLGTLDHSEEGRWVKVQSHDILCGEFSNVTRNDMLNYELVRPNPTRSITLSEAFAEDTISDHGGPPMEVLVRYRVFRIILERKHMTRDYDGPDVYIPRLMIDK